jgi:hypothetical protein
MKPSVAILPLLVCVLGACSATEQVAEQTQASQTHLNEQGAVLGDTMQHLQEASRRLAGQADPNRAGDELTAGRLGVQQASILNQTIRQDVTELSKSAASLQQQIDDHRNDWLGPRARRLRNRIIVLLILVSIGAALLKLGPLFGGPFGGGAIVAGHLLTAFALPLIRGIWTVLGYVWTETIAAAKWLAEKLTNLAAANAPANSPPSVTSASIGQGGASDAAA